MDTRTARRAAEKAARDLINDRAALIGELAVARADRTQLDTDITAACERGRQLVAAAEAEAAGLLDTAQAGVRQADQRYADVYSAATAAGWAAADLTALGFAPGNSPRRRRSTTSSAGPDQPPITLPAQPASEPGEHSVPEPAAVTP